MDYGGNMDMFYSPYEEELKKIIRNLLEKGMNEEDILKLYLVNLEEVIDENIKKDKNIDEK